MDVFLGGTCNNTVWRDELITAMRGSPINLINPVVKDWTPACSLIEEIQKRHKCAVHLYYITSDMTGVYSIAEAVQSSNQPGTVTLFQFDPVGFTEGQLKSLRATADIIKSNGQYTLESGDIRETKKILETLNL